MPRLDDMLVVRVYSSQKQALKGASEASQMSEGAIVRELIDMAVDSGYLEPPYHFFNLVNRLRNQDQESARS